MRIGRRTPALLAVTSVLAAGCGDAPPADDPAIPAYASCSGTGAEIRSLAGDSTRVLLRRPAC